jgi:peptide/nickel transport system substrate-binding protein
MPRSFASILVVAVALVSACAGPTSAPTGTNDAQQGQGSAPPRTKALTIGVTGSVPALSIVGGSSPVGGWVALTEMHTDGLVTADTSVHKPIGRMAERVPSLDDGTISLLPDGRMRVQFTLRKGITWQDGEPFTAQDLVFSYRIGGPDGLPTSTNDAMRVISSVEAPDPSTFVIYYKEPYALGAALGPIMYWPLPEHLLADSYARYAASKNTNDILQDPYWTSGYVSTGAFRLTQFDPGAGMEFQAYDGYYLGRPKIDVIHVRIFNDDTTLLSNILAGAVDLTPELALRQATGVPLQETWKGNGGGTVFVSDNAIRYLEPQFRPSVQMEQAVLDPRVRTALYHALDIEALSDAVNGGNPQLAAWSILPKSDPLYEVTRDTLRPFAYNPDRAKALLADLGWTLGSDGALRNNADGRSFRTSIWASLGADEEIGAYASYWRKVGLEVEEHITSAAESRDQAARAQYPGWDIFSGEITNWIGQVAASPQTRWTGNRNGFEDPQAQRLSAAFQNSLAPAERAQAVKAINDYVISQMLVLPTFYQAVWMAARKGVKAYDDLAGGYGAHVGNNGFWGSFYRNAYLWDVQ